jgi:hypothetical protein
MDVDNSVHTHTGTAAAAVHIPLHVIPEYSSCINTDVEPLHVQNDSSSSSSSNQVAVVDHILWEVHATEQSVKATVALLVLEVWHC